MLSYVAVPIDLVSDFIPVLGSTPTGTTKPVSFDGRSNWPSGAGESRGDPRT